MHYIEQFLEKKAGGLSAAQLLKLYGSTILGGAATGAGLGLGAAGLKAIYDKATNDKKDFNSKKNTKRLLKKGLIGGGVTGGALGLGLGAAGHATINAINGLAEDLTGVIGETMLNVGIEGTLNGLESILKNGIPKK